MKYCEPLLHDVCLNFDADLVCVKCLCLFVANRYRYNHEWFQPNSDMHRSLQYKYGPEWEFELLRLKSAQYLMRRMKRLKYERDKLIDMSFYTYDSFAKLPVGQHLKILSPYEKDLLRNSNEQ